MALIIKGDMPTCCWDCDRDRETNCPLSASNEVYEEWKDVENEARHPDCPIIGEIPDRHGRMVDIDRLIREFRLWGLASVRRNNVEIAELLEHIAETDTVLEASE